MDGMAKWVTKRVLFVIGQSLYRTSLLSTGWF